MARMPRKSPVESLRRLCLALPEVTERLSHGEPTWFVRGKKTFVMFSNHHHDDRVGFWCAAPPDAQETLVAADPRRFFRPPYVGHRGWLGVYLDVPKLDWEQIAELVVEAYRTVAPATLVARLDSVREEPAPQPSRPSRSRSRASTRRATSSSRASASTRTR